MSEQVKQLRAEAAEWEAEAAVWAEREANLAGQTAYYLQIKDEASADVFEERRRQAEAEWLRFCRMGEDCRRKASDIEAEVRKLRDLAFVVRAA